MGERWGKHVCCCGPKRWIERYADVVVSFGLVWEKWVEYERMSRCRLMMCHRFWG